MSGLGLEQSQRSSQVHSQRMTQKKILSMRLLSMGSQELRSEILKKAEENPAIEIERDPLSEGEEYADGAVVFSDGIYQAGKSGSSGTKASDTFQKMLESAPCRDETLQEHLISQLNMARLSDLEYKVCRLIITNLDKNGFHILSPASLPYSAEVCAQEVPAVAQELVERCIRIVQRFDPAGICVANVRESLLLQTELDKGAPPLAKFFLDGHLELLVPPVPEKIRRKLLDFLSEEERLSFKGGGDEHPRISKRDATEAAVAKALCFIRSLNPHPAAGFRDDGAQAFIRPDVYVVRCQGELERERPEEGLVLDGISGYFRIILADGVLPSVRISSGFQNPISAGKSSPDERKFVRKTLADAQNFIDTIAFRDEVMLRSCSLLVKCQKDFFREGPGHLVPMSQRQFAREIGVHESTVSRVADSKFISCFWGTFPIKYFFTAAFASPKSEGGSAQAVSGDAIRHEILEILKGQMPEEKRLSDQRLAEELLRRGYKVARRTVAKYRSQLDIAPSHRR